MQRKKSVGIVGYSCDFGGTVAGSKDGPEALRARGLLEVCRSLGWEAHDYGDVKNPAPRTPSLPFSPGELKSKNYQEVYASCAELHARVTQILKDGYLPIVLGGDHSLSIGSVPAVADFYREKGETIGLLWVDAHPDINTPETSPSGNFFGMSVAVLLGLMPGALSSLQQFPPAITFQNLAFIGLRDVDPGERELLNARSKTAFAMDAIDGEGIRTIVDSALCAVSDNTAGFVLSFDLDACDPNFAPGTGTPKRGGLTYRECHYILERAARTGKLLGVEFVELNPRLDPNGDTAEVALSLVTSALGKSIL